MEPGIEVSIQGENILKPMHMRAIEFFHGINPTKSVQQRNNRGSVIFLDCKWMNIGGIHGVDGECSTCLAFSIFSLLVISNICVALVDVNGVLPSSTMRPSSIEYVSIIPEIMHR